jgi:glycosyltransferase involved in cell wall biosynthesis
MRVVLDLQACQASSRFRGVGRYSMSLAHALVAELLGRGHEVVIALNGSFRDEVTQVRASFEKRFSGLRYFEFSIPSPCAAKDMNNQWRQMASRLLRECALASLEPDMVHVATLMADGWEDDTVASVGLLGLHVPTALTHYDLIPLVMSDIYMPGESDFRDYYMEKLGNVSRADLLLAISDFSKTEALTWLDRDEASVVNISSAVNEDFVESAGGQHDVQRTLQKYGVPPDFLLYAPGGFDPRKNLNHLLQAYSLLPADVRTRHKLVIASKLPQGLREGLIWKAGTFGVSAEDLVITDYVPDCDLVDLYRACRVYVFPSLHEGFGLPALEAMSCGAVVIASNCSSIPEAHGSEEALFDPYLPESIAEKMLVALSDEKFRSRLQVHATQQPGKFSWAKSALVAVDAMERVNAKLLESGWRPSEVVDLPSERTMLDLLSQMNLAVVPGETDLSSFHACYESNKRRAQT